MYPAKLSRYENEEFRVERGAAPALPSLCSVLINDMGISSRLSSG